MHSNSGTGDPLARRTTQLLIQKVGAPSGGEQVQYLQLTHEDEQGRAGHQRTIILQQVTRNSVLILQLEITAIQWGSEI